MNNKKILKDIKDDFGLSIEKRENKDFDDQENFDSLIDKISEDIPGDEKENIEDRDNTDKIISETCKVEDIKKKIEDSILEEKNEIDFDSIEVEEEKVEKKVNEEIKNSKDVEKEKYCSLEIKNNKIQWQINSPGSLFNFFYEYKKTVVNELLTRLGGQLDIDALLKELEVATVNVDSESFDNTYYRIQMGKVQQLRSRVKDIQVKCNKQYFVMERFVELLRGSLARVMYLKPQVKQEGLIAEHMGDIELYFCKLKSLYKSAHGVMENLDGIFETLSRAATITSPQSSGDRYGKSRENRDEEPRENLSSYDQLPRGIEIDKNKKTGKIGWTDIV